MRSLSDSTKNVKVTSKAKEDEQNDKINNLIDEVEDLDSRMDTAENNISALSETVSTNTVIANDVQADDVSTNTLSANTIEADTSIETKQLDTEDITSTGISRLNTVRATSGEITTLESQNVTIENATITNADITNIDIENLSGTNMSYENATFDDVDVNNNIDVDGNVIVGGNITASGTLSVPSGSVSSLSSNEINATDVEATNVEATNGKITFLKNRHLTHDDNYVDINQVVSDTDFVIIELPKIETGDYRVTYKQLVDGYPALTMFSLTLNETADNQWFSYSRAGDQKYMDEIAIKDGKLYIKTWYTGRLYFHSDSLANITGPKSYGEWPIDTTDLDYPLFSATRAKATVYTHYVNLGMDADSYGSAVLTINPTSNYEDCATQAETAPEIQYDPNTDKQIYLYVPNQDVNKEADVEFENAKINDTLTIPENAAIDIEDMADGQYITKRDGATTYRDIADGQIDDQPLSRLEDDLVTERKIANWNGATNREHVPGTDSYTETYQSSDITQIPSANSLNGQYYYTDGTGATLDELIESSTYCKPALFIEGAEHGGTKIKTVNPEGSLDIIRILRSRGYEIVGFPRLDGNTYNAMVYGAEYNPDDSYSLNDINDALSRGTQILLVTSSSLDYVLVLTPGNYTGEEGLYGDINHAEIKLIESISSITRANPNRFTVNYTETTTTTNDYYTSSLDYKSNLPADATLVEMTTSSFEYEKTFAEVAPIYSSSITHVGKITEGEWDAGQIVAPKVITDELTADELTVDNDLSVTGNASIGGNLNVTGTIITVHSEEITTEENTIKLRDGAQTAIQPGDMSGIIIENYDGQGNDSEIALDSNGTLRIGDTNDTEPVATRDEAANFTNGNYIAWDATNSRLVDSGTAPTDLREWALIVGFDEYEDKTGDTSYTDIDDILTTLTTYTVSKGITSVLFEAPITSQTEFDLLNLTPTWLASGYLTGTLKILGGNVTFISKDNNIGWRYDGSTWSSLDVKTHAQIKLNYTGDWSTQTAAQKMDIGESYNADTEAVYVTGDVAGKHLVIAPTETYAKNATAQNVEVDQNNGTVGYLMKGGYSFTGVLKIPVGNPWNLIPTGTNIPAGTMWVN